MKYIQYLNYEMYISFIEIFSLQKNIHFRIVSDFKKLFRLFFT